MSSRMNNNNLPFGPLNGVSTPPRKLSLNNGRIPVQGLTAENEKLINKYTRQYLNLGLPLNDAKRAARNNFEIQRSQKKTRKNRKSRKSRKQRKRYNS